MKDFALNLIAIGLALVGMAGAMCLLAYRDNPELAIKGIVVAIGCLGSLNVISIIKEQK